MGCEIGHGPAYGLAAWMLGYRSCVDLLRNVGVEQRDLFDEAAEHRRGPPPRYVIDTLTANGVERLAVGQQPTAGDLSAAPIIDDWTIADRQESALAGLISGHPVLGTRPGITSSVFALDLDHGWARTWSRWYRLGQKSVRGQQ